MPAAACVDLRQGEHQVPYRDLADNHHIQKPIGDIGGWGETQTAAGRRSIEDKIPQVAAEMERSSSKVMVTW